MDSDSGLPNTGLYADEAPGSLIEPPTSEQYHAGVEPEMTCPGPWWNFFMNLFTNTNIKAKAAINNILAELNNALIAFGITPDSGVSTQLRTLLTQSIISRTFSAVGGTNPFTASTPLTPYNIGDVVINTTSLEVWQGISKAGATTDWLLLVGDKKTIEVDSASYTVGKDVEEVAVTTSVTPVNMVIPAGSPKYRRLRISRPVGSTKQVSVSVRGGETLPMTPFIAVTAPALDWYGVCSDPSGNIWAVAYSDGIYKCPVGDTTFTAVAAPTSGWYRICSDPSGNIWAGTINGGIYKCPVGDTTFIVMTTPTLDWHGICSDPSGNIWAAATSGDIYKCPVGNTTFTAVTAPTLDWNGVCSDPSGNIWAVASSSSICKCPVGNTTFTPVTAPASGWNSVCSDPSGNIWAVAYSDGIYKCPVGDTTFTAVAAPTSGWNSVCSDPSGNIWAVASDYSIHKCPVGNTTFTPVAASSTNRYNICSDPSGNIYACTTSVGTISIGGDQCFITHGASTSPIDNQQVIDLERDATGKWRWVSGEVISEIGGYATYYRRPDGRHRAEIIGTTPAEAGAIVTAFTKLDPLKCILVNGSYSCGGAACYPFNRIDAAGERYTHVNAFIDTNRDLNVQSSAIANSDTLSKPYIATIDYID